jgi:hypothetical protein
MPRKRLKIGIQIVGTRFPRFVIVNNRKQFWGGGDWTTDLRKALLYAHAWRVQRDVEELRLKNCP